MPIGIISYYGSLVGYVVDNSGSKSFVEGDVTLTFDSSTSNLTANLIKLQEGVGMNTLNDLNFSAPVSGSSFTASSVIALANSGLTAPTSAAALSAGLCTGSLAGHFFGPVANELSLTFQMTGVGRVGGAVKMVGTIAAKR